MKFSDVVKCCLNPKVIIGVLLFLGTIFIFLPKALVGGILPFLLVLICPLSMVFMMKAMRSSDKSENKNNSKHS